MIGNSIIIYKSKPSFFLPGGVVSTTTILLWPSLQIFFLEIMIEFLSIIRDKVELWEKQV